MAPVRDQNLNQSLARTKETCRRDLHRGLAEDRSVLGLYDGLRNEEHKDVYQRVRLENLPTATRRGPCGSKL